MYAVGFKLVEKGECSCGGWYVGYPVLVKVVDGRFLPVLFGSLRGACKRKQSVELPGALWKPKTDRGLGAGIIRLVGF